MKNQKLIKTENITAILNLIRKSGEISKADMARILKLSPTTVSNLMGELEQLGLVIERRVGESVGGRRPILMSVSPSRGFFAAISLEYHSIRLGFYDLSRAPLFFTEQKGQMEELFDQNVTEKVIRLIQKGLQKTGLNPSALFGITVGVEGIMDEKKQVVLSSTVYPSLKDANLFDGLREKYRVPVQIENSTHMAAAAEKELNPAYREMSSLAFMEVGSGIGAGVIVNNQLYYGSFGGAGEIGHIPVEVFGPVCACGNRGCLEAVAGLDAFLTRAAENLTGDHSIESVARAARDGNLSALALVELEGRYLSIGVINLINTFNPEAVVIGGEVAELGKPLLSAIRANIEQTIFGLYLSRMTLALSQVGLDFKLEGASIKALKRFFEKPGEIFDFEKSNE